LNGEEIDFSKYKGKVVLIQNTASLWGTTVRDFTQVIKKYSV
jgi:glutathione peroxidase